MKITDYQFSIYHFFILTKILMYSCDASWKHNNVMVHAKLYLSSFFIECKTVFGYRSSIIPLLLLPDWLLPVNLVK